MAVRGGDAAIAVQGAGGTHLDTLGACCLLAEIIGGAESGAALLERDGGQYQEYVLETVTQALKRAGFAGNLAWNANDHRYPVSFEIQQVRRLWSKHWAWAVWQINDPRQRPMLQRDPTPDPLQRTPFTIWGFDYSFLRHPFFCDS